MTTEEIVYEAMKMMGAGGVSSIATTIIFLKFYRRNGKSPSPQPTFVPPECPVHGGVMERLKSGDKNFESLRKDLSDITTLVARIDERTEILVKNLK